MPSVLASVAFKATIVEWRGPAPFLFLPVPAEHFAELRYAAREASYGWGCIPASARIGKTSFTTSLFPRDGTYFLPVKVAVQRAEGLTLGDSAKAQIAIHRA